MKRQPIITFCCFPGIDTSVGTGTSVLVLDPLCVCVLCKLAPKKATNGWSHPRSRNCESKRACRLQGRTHSFVGLFRAPEFRLLIVFH